MLIEPLKYPLLLLHCVYDLRYAETPLASLLPIDVCMLCVCVCVCACMNVHNYHSPPHRNRYQSLDPFLKYGTFECEY